MTNILTNKMRNALIAIYVLVILGLSATAKANLAFFPINGENKTVHTKSYTGEVAHATNGKFYLQVSEEEFYELKSNVDLTEYDGNVVEVEGYELKHKVGPVFDLYSVDPLPGKRETVAPVLIVFEINEAY